jgi:hypothetical protein
MHGVTTKVKSQGAIKFVKDKPVMHQFGVSKSHYHTR